MTHSQGHHYYIKYESVTFEEDVTHEFKGHKNLSVDELPKWTQATKWERGSRKAVSRNLCGFLNTGLGGTVYCGVLDDGMVVGLKLTQYQRDHVIGSLADLMSRYSPPVPQHRFKVRFVPVLSANTTEKEKEELLKVKSRELVDVAERKREHLLRQPHYCWCDKDCKMQFENGIIPTDYVIEITIKPWNSDDPDNKGIGDFLNLHPLHADEDGKLHFRRHGRLIQYTLPEVANLTRYEARSRCDTIIDRLESQVKAMKLLIASKRQTQQDSLEEESSQSR